MWASSSGGTIDWSLALARGNQGSPWLQSRRLTFESSFPHPDAVISDEANRNVAV